MKILRYTIKEQNLKQDYLWNMAGNLCNAAHSVLMLAFVSRFCGVEDAGIFSLTFSVAQMMYLISCFEMVNVLITDSQKKFLFYDTVLFRIFTIGIMVVCAVIFAVINHFEGRKLLTFLLLIAYMVLLTITELCESNLHRNGYLALAGRGLAINISLNSVVFALVLYISRNMPAAILAMCCTVVVWLCVYEIPYLHAAGIHEQKSEAILKSVLHFLKLCAPLVCMRLVMSYIINAPKLAIDASLTLQEQSFFGYMMMPAACVNLLSLFALRPQLINLSNAYMQRDKKWFEKITGGLLVWNLIIAVCVLLGGYVLGIPILSVFYGVNLTGNKLTLCTVLLGGCFYAFATLFDTVATTIRVHQWNLLVYIPTFLLASLLCNRFVQYYGLMGAALSYALMMLLLAVGSGCILLAALKRKLK